VIINPLVKRRPNRRPPPPVSAPPRASQPAAKSKPAESAKEAKPLISSTKAEPKQQSAAAKDFFGKGKDKGKPGSEPSSKEGTPAPNTASLKRESSNLFKAFAKSKPKLKTEETGSSAGGEDEVMTDAVHFDEDEEETYVPPVQNEESVGDRKSRKEREAKLRAMMEEDDDDKPAPAPKPDPEEEEEEQPIVEEAKSKEEPEPQTTVSGGRRRGKKRVMKKKTIKDDEGYLGKFIFRISILLWRNCEYSAGFVS
jgi:DNA polymerase delta subunit 3